MAYSYLLLLITFIALTYVSSISFYHSDTDDRCFKKSFMKGENMTMYYAISGEYENNYKVYIKKKDGIPVFEENGRVDGEYTQIIEDADDYVLCFHPKKKVENSVTFDFHGSEEGGHLIKIAKGDNLNQMQKDIVSISSMFEQIEMNIKFLTERYTKHSESKCIKNYIFYLIHVS